MKNLFFIILIFSSIFSEDYIFSENIRITESSNDQKFPEIAIDENGCETFCPVKCDETEMVCSGAKDDYGCQEGPDMCITIKDGECPGFCPVFCGKDEFECEGTPFKISNLF